MTPGQWHAWCLAKAALESDTGCKMTDTEMMFVFAGMILDDQEQRRSTPQCMCCGKPIKHRARRYKTRRRHR